MKAIVHIGTEKTGTTSIQQFLYLNRRKLNTAGFHFIQSAGKTNNRAIPSYCMEHDKFDDFFREEGIRTLEAKEEFKSKFIKEFENEIQTVPATIHTIIISSEHLHSRIRSEDEVDNVHQLLSTYFDDIKIVCYLREQVATCTSYYSTHLKSGGTDSFEAFLQRCKPGNHYFNYFGMLENWERCFGFEALDVSLFAHDRFLNGNLLDDFTSKLDPALIGHLNKAVRAENESLKPAGQALTRAINLAFPYGSERAEIGELRTRCRKIVAQGLTGKGQQPDLDTWKSIHESFIESNEQLRQKFFPQTEQLFNLPEKAESVGITFDEHAIGVMTTLFTALKTFGKDILSPDEYTRAYTIILSSMGNRTKAGFGEKKIGTGAILDERESRLLLRAAVRIEKLDPDTALELVSLASEIGQRLPGIEFKLREYSRSVEKIPKLRFLLIYREGVTPSDPNESQRRGIEFDKWIAALDVPSGSPLFPISIAGTVSSERNAGAADQSSAVAFSIFRAESLEQALSLVNSCPFLDIGRSLEVFEIKDLIGS